MAYFDNAATTFPKPECVYAAMDEFYRRSGGSAGRGGYGKALSARSLVDETRQLLRDLLHCPAKQVIFTPTATIALNMIIQGVIAAGAKNVYITPFEHNAVTRVLHHFEKQGQIRVMQLAVDRETLEYDQEKIRYQFEDVKPDLVLMSHASNVIGLISPVEAIATIAKQYGTVTVVDMAQTAGLVDLNVGLESIDFAVFAGHKTLMGPTGISGFVINTAYKLPPVLFGGTGYDSANQDMPDSLPERYEMGTMNTVGVAGLNAALKWLFTQGIDKVRAEEEKKRERLLQLLGQYHFLQIVGNVDGGEYVGIVSCLMEGISSDAAGSIFSERNIAVRTGLQCAPLAHQFLGTFPAGTIRFSVNCLTSEEDFTKLREALNDIEDNL